MRIKDEIIEEDKNIHKKKNPFLDFTDENPQSQTCKECEEKKTFLILQMKSFFFRLMQRM